MRIKYEKQKGAEFISALETAWFTKCQGSIHKLKGGKLVSMLVHLAAFYYSISNFLRIQKKSKLARSLHPHHNIWMQENKRKKTIKRKKSLFPRPIVSKGRLTKFTLTSPHKHTRLLAINQAYARSQSCLDFWLPMNVSPLGAGRRERGKVSQIYENRILLVNAISVTRPRQTHCHSPQQATPMWPTCNRHAASFILAPSSGPAKVSSQFEWRPALSELQPKLKQTLKRNNLAIAVRLPSIDVALELLQP